jgi:predicted RNA-binding protein
MVGQGQGEELIMEDVLYVKVNGAEISLSTLMGESKTVLGQVKEIDMENHKVIIEKEGELD